MRCWSLSTDTLSIIKFEELIFLKIISALVCLFDTKGGKIIIIINQSSLYYLNHQDLVPIYFTLTCKLPKLDIQQKQKSSSDLTCGVSRIFLNFLNVWILAQFLLKAALQKCAKIKISMEISISGEKICCRNRKWDFSWSKVEVFQKASYL